MLPSMSDEMLTPTVMRLLQETEIPRRQSIREHSLTHRIQPNLQAMPRLDLDEDCTPLTTNHRVIPRLDLDEEYIPSTPPRPTYRGRMHLALGIPETTKPVRTPDLFQTIIEPTSPVSSGLGDEEPVYASVYVTFPAYRPACVSKAQMAKNYAKKIKTCLATVGSKCLTGLQSIGESYVRSNRKLENEYRPLESIPSNYPSVWEAVDAADRVARAKQAQRTKQRSQKSWSKTLRNYWVPEVPGQSFGPSSSVRHPCDEGANAIPPILNVLRKQNNQCCERPQSSHQPAEPLQSGQTIESFENSRQSRPSLRPHQRKEQTLSLPSGLPYPLERYLCSTERTFEQVNNRPALRIVTASNDIVSIAFSWDSDSQSDNDYVQAWVRGKRLKELNEMERAREVHGARLGEGQGQGQGQADLATPWSGLQTVPEEPYFGGEQGEWLLEQQRRISVWLRDDQTVGGESSRLGRGYNFHLHTDEEEEGRWRCDGFEASGELCLRHSHCLREALAIAGSGGN